MRLRWPEFKGKPTDPAWIAERDGGVGCSELGYIFGLQPQYGTALSVAQDKMGLSENRFAGNEATHWGNIHEAQIAKEFSRRTGARLEESGTLPHPTIPGFFGTPDRIVKGFSPPALVQIKTVNAYSHKNYWGEDMTDAVPDAYLLQVQGEMSITGADHVYLAALVGGNNLHCYLIERCPDTIAMIERVVTCFLRDHLDVGVLPDREVWSRNTLLTEWGDPAAKTHLPIGMEGLRLRTQGFADKVCGL